MPDIQSELSKVLNEWDNPIENINQPENQVKQLFTPTNNVTSSTFNMIRDNPSITKKEAVQKLTVSNFNPASTSSLIAQMLKQRLVRDEGGKLYANFSEYTPLKSGASVRDKAAKKTKVVRATAPAHKQDGGIAALQPQATPITPKTALNDHTRRVMDIDDWLNEVPLMQAHMVYVKLKAIFEGENK